MASCAEAGGERARLVLHWLESLSIPMGRAGRRGDCSTCEAFLPCREVALGITADMATCSGEKEHWMKELRSKTGPDGHCERRPIIRKVIAALCVSGDQFLGKLVAKMVVDGDGVDLDAEQSVRAWFERQIPFSDYILPNLLFVFKMLVLAFYFHHNQQRGLEPLHGFPRQPAQQGPAAIESSDSGSDCPPWDNAEEVSLWEASIDWWVDKCGFCAGRGLRGSYIKHTLRQCERGGKKVVRGELGEAVYLEGIVPSQGCRSCRLPYDFCYSWFRDEDGDWKTQTNMRPQCQYSNRLLIDTVLGLYCCGNSKFRDVILDDMVDEFDVEAVACYLASPVTVVGVEGSQMIRTLGVLTRMVWDSI
ncbi:hypothetical protein B0T10DRAFT_465766 [Thelonectria olida]|uniref:Uncharacterized protein n=1 Tax=Thelonectria olida TaxID=1576542 RepID=A0A9P8VT86_9HYPO|nr:hypothetical protein B0T10DRAFT_465766 [Thelonectria olida]